MRCLCQSHWLAAQYREWLRIRQDGLKNPLRVTKKWLQFVLAWPSRFRLAACAISFGLSRFQRFQGLFARWRMPITTQGGGKHHGHLDALLHYRNNCFVRASVGEAVAPRFQLRLYAFNEHIMAIVVKNACVCP